MYTQAVNLHTIVSDFTDTQGYEMQNSIFHKQVLICIHLLGTNAHLGSIG